MTTIESFTLDDTFSFDAPRGFSRTVDFRRVRSGCGSDEAFSRWIMAMACHGIRHRCSGKYSITQGNAEFKNTKTLELIDAFHNGETGSGRSTDPVVVEVKALLRKSKLNSKVIKGIHTLNDVERILGDKAEAYIRAAKTKIEFEEEFLGKMKS